MPRKRLWVPEVLAVLVAAALGWWLFADGNRDLAWATAWFDPVGGRWTGEDKLWVWCFYKSGGWPAVGAAIGAALLLIGMWRLPRLAALRPRWRSCAFVVLAVALGPGLVVHEGFKPFFDRPRPRETAPFVADGRPFQTAWTVAAQGTGHAFVSGHGAISFATAMGWLLLRRRRPWTAAAVLTAGLAWGVAVSAARMAVGGHWASDLWWSAVVTWTVGLALWYGLRVDAAAEAADHRAGQAASG